LGAGAELLIGKNTVIKKALDMRTNPLDKDMEDFDFFNQFGEPMTDLTKLRELMVGKFGLIFTNSSVFDLKSIIKGNRRGASAKVGAISDVEVVVPPGPTGMDPS